MSGAHPMPASSAVALLHQLEVAGVTRCADVGGTAFDAALATWQRHDCDIVLIDMDQSGKFLSEASPWCASYCKRLIDAGVSQNQIKRIGREGDLMACDIVFALNGFGDRFKIKHLASVLTSALHSESRLVLDIRKGSGAFPFLKDYGSTEILEHLEGDDLRRVVLLPSGRAPLSTGSYATWTAMARTLAGPDGFFSDGPDGHSFLFVPRDPKVLVVTFDNLDIAMNKRAERRPWGYEFIEKQNWSMLGVMAGGWTWYRNEWVTGEFDKLRDAGFFRRFERVVFYGASMGGYAAAAFSSAAPGSDVVAISPQSTLDRKLVPFESRYKTAWHYNFDGPYGDAAQTSLTARRTIILYDPYEPLDSAHVNRFAGGNVIKLRCPLMGHRLGTSLLQMGILSTTILEALSGTLCTTTFYRRLRQRRNFPRYQTELFRRALARNRPELARRVAHWVLRQGENKAVRLGLAELDRVAPRKPDGSKGSDAGEC